ncbi:MAG: FAD-dependent oxidoreductase [Rhodobacteraceae bacterium]|nr:FAD-dependent oxidoreductase [Paracoccaceae bacterium]
MKYSGFRVIKEALTGHRGWGPAWRSPDPSSEYDYVIIGGGGHGLATAYYLAKEFKQSKIAVLEKGWIGGGNVGRNTTIIRSNYLLDGNEPFYEFSLKLWEGLEKELNYNAMVSQRGILNLIHSDAQRDAFVRRGNAMLLNGADADLLTTEQIKKRYPFLNTDNARFPIKGGLAQHRGGTVRHDAVAWGYADKGGLVFGGDIDGYNSYAQRGNLPVVEDVCEGGMAIFPMLGRVRLLRMWGGIMDMSMDGSPIIDKTDISGLYFNGGWCYGGFKATPASGWVYAHLLATKEPHKTARAFRFDRFSKGLMIDEKGMGNQPNLH